MVQMLRFLSAQPLGLPKALTGGVDKKGDVMASRNVGSKRARSDDPEVPAELARREAQDRAGSKAGAGRAKSPVDAMHVDEPKHQKNARGHKTKKSL
jgi:hypothetical protein